ncbi:hypothetical protein OAV48_01185 [bacterium]|nr:hypothetical protein [bacterium]
MALEKMVSDLSNFKTKGDVAYDKLDPQIENGVDYFPNHDAPGFTPKTDLESLYKKANSAVPANASGFVPASDGQLSQTWGSTFPTQFKNGFFPIANAVSNYNPPANESLTFNMGDFSFNNVPKVSSADGSDFMTTPLANFVSMFKVPYNSQVFDVQQHISSGPTQFNIEPFDNTPSVPNAHGGDFMTTPIASYNSRFSLSTPLGAGTKTLKVRKEAFRQSTEAGVSNTDKFTKPFSVDTTKSIYNDSSYIKDLFEFKTDGRDTFKNVPSGMDDNGLFGTDNFRKVANRGPFSGNDNHPLILRETGNKWGIDANSGLLQTLDQTAGGFVRGAPGITGLVDRSLQDKVRIMRFMFTTNLGLAFITKQFALQALNPTLESKIWNPASALSLTGVGQIVSGLVSTVTGGGRPSGADLLRAATSAAISAAFPIGHPERHLGGLKYEDVNPLDRLDGDKGLGKKIKSIPVVGNTLFNKINDKIDDVGGFSRLGAQASMKIGGITIPLKDRMLMMNPNKYLFPISSAPMKVVDGVPHFTIEAGSGNGSAAKAEADKAETKVGGTFNSQTAINNDSELIKRHASLAYDALNNSRDYESLLLSSAEQLGVSDEYTVNSYERRFKEKDINTDIGVNANHVIPTDNPVLGAIKGDMLSSNVDKVNMTPYGASVDGERINVNDSVTTKDFIKFRFKDVINDKFLIFRAILEGITDTVTPEYAEDRYIGRPDKLFVYQGVDRSIAFTFSLYPKTKQELPILMEKLNYLVGLCYPSYTEGERMVSPFIELTMGDMFVETPGILSSLTVTVEEQSTWELDEGLQFPHFIKAACEFRHIGKYAPATKGKHYDLNWIESDGSSHEVAGAPNKNIYTDKSELGFPKYPERDETWRKNVFEQLGQGKVGAEQ